MQSVNNNDVVSHHHHLNILRETASQNWSNCLWMSVNQQTNKSGNWKLEFQFEVNTHTQHTGKLFCFRFIIFFLPFSLSFSLSLTQFTFFILFRIESTKQWQHNYWGLWNFWCLQMAFFGTKRQCYLFSFACFKHPENVIIYIFSFRFRPSFCVFLDDICRFVW